MLTGGWKHACLCRETFPTLGTVPDPRTHDPSGSSDQQMWLTNLFRNYFQDRWFQHSKHPDNKSENCCERTALVPSLKIWSFSAQTLVSSSSIFILFCSSSSRIWFPSRSNRVKASEISWSACPILQDHQSSEELVTFKSEYALLSTCFDLPFESFPEVLEFNLYRSRS